MIVSSADISAQPGPVDLAPDRIGLVALHWSRVVLFVSMVMLATAPLFISDSYSPVEHTISESGAQGVPGAWIQRTGVVLAACAVLVMTLNAGPVWSRTARRWIRVYALALVLLAVFPESPWNGGPHDVVVATVHTVAGVCAAVAFIVGIVGVSLSSQRPRWARSYDLLMVGAVILVPQLMLLWPFDGVLQRAMVALGYGWLFLEGRRLMLYAKPIEAPPPQGL